MTKQSSSEKANIKSQSSSKVNENKTLFPSQNMIDLKIKKKSKCKDIIVIKSEFIKKECEIPDIECVENYLLLDKDTENIENSCDKNQKLKKKCPSKLKEPDDNKMVFLSDFSQLKLSQSVIVNSVIKGTKIDQKIDALLPESLGIIYNKFINSNRYIESLHNKDDFFCGIGLLGVNIEEKIYNKRKSLEDSLKRGIRLRPNPKPTKLFDGTVINRPVRNCNNGSKSLKSASRPMVLRGKTKYNLFNIGIDSTKKKNRRSLRKPMKKKIGGGRSVSQKFVMKKDGGNSGSSDEETDDINSKSIAFTRPKRLQKVPKLDFKYCYGDRTSNNRKIDDSNSDGAKSVEYNKEYLEIVDSDSSSVVEVSPPNDIDLSDDSDEINTGKAKETERSRKVKCSLNMRRGWRPKESKALNLLDKLRLGLQCRIIQTEQDIIIQNLSLEDLATLQSRIQGLATFKNIEAEYDKNGQETARATIDRKLLNLPLKLSDNHIADVKSVPPKRYEESLKRKLLSSQTSNRPVDRKKIILHDKSVDDASKASKFNPPSNASLKSEEASIWIRPKGRSVKKVRKLYTQSGSTPNILARSQMSSRSEGLLTTSSSSNRRVTNQHVSKTPQSLSFSQPSIIGTDSMGHSLGLGLNHNQHATSVSFYSQLSTISSNILAPVVPIIAKSIISTEISKPISAAASISVTAPINTVDLPVTTETVVEVVPTVVSTTTTTVSNCSAISESVKINSSGDLQSNSPQVSSESIKKSITIEKIVTPTNRTADLVSPATSMSASQLLMLKRGVSQGTSGSSANVNDAGPATSSVVSVVNNNEQLYANQILKPFKKTFVTSSPPKLELDDEEMEADFELTPSMITQVKNVTVSNNLPVPQIISNKNTFLSKPLIQASGIGPRRPISLPNAPNFQTQNPILTSSSSIQTCCVTAVNAKPAAAIDKPVVCVVSAQPIALPNSGITGTANIPVNNNNNINITSISMINNTSNSNNSIINNNIAANINNNNNNNNISDNISININNNNNSINANNNISNSINININNNPNTCQNSNSSIKIKPRKWTHNFHTSNSINFREVLCPNRSTNILQPLLNSQVQQLTNLNPSSSINTIPVPKPIPIPNTVTSNVINPLRSPEKSNQIPSKGSSAVLKSLLVGSNSSNDLCNVNKSGNWATKYLSSTSSLQDSSKIKWQVGGTVTASLPNLMSPVSKE